MNIDAYFEAFSTGDDDAVVDQWFADDVVFQYQDQIIEGKTPWREFLRYAHDGIREVMRPVTVISCDDHVFAEVDMDCHARHDRPDFPFGPLSTGDMYTIKFFVSYAISGDKIDRLKMATWPANVGTSSMPRLGGRHITQIAAFAALQRALAVGDGVGAVQYCHSRREPRALVAKMRERLVQSASLTSAHDEELRLDSAGETVRLQLIDGVIAGVA